MRFLTWNGRVRPVTPKPDATLLLMEFAERFDQGFLPTRAIVLP